ncbi:MAG TPA: hypothetical protein VG387_01000 [Rhizomicrobium sp.]|jgi:hypothetical protein|nr:hypothetical protein [Rhizomicrobium sp.]
MQERVVGAFKQVIGFVMQGVDFDSHGWRSFEAEMRELIAPHIAVLAHRRAKLLDGSDGQRWADELEGFMRTGLWPLLAEERDFADKNRAFVGLMLDVQIAEEQRRQQVSARDALPQVSAFDASWAS